MSGLQGRFLNGTGNLMPVHAAGFHGLQAIPLVALLLGWSGVPAAHATRWIHAAGSGWLLLCAGFVAQAAAGLPPLAPSPAAVPSWLGAFVCA
ncbi:MAG: hypothetical protein ACRELD_13715, partial [Longimicrobiales bacterium]